MRILAVDDDTIILQLLEEILKNAGYPEFQSATSGPEALQIINADPEGFDCFLLDIQMPEMDGIELCRRIRAMRLYARVPILMITAMSDKSYVDRSFMAGATDYVTKPFDVLELVTRVRLADRLTEESRRVADRDQALRALQAEVEEKERRSLDEPVDIDDVDGVIDYFAFENYLLQLGRGRLFMSALLAVKVANISEIFSRCSPRCFRNFVTDVAEALSDSIVGQDFLMAYRGSGIFVIAFDRRFAESIADELREDFPARLAEFSPLHDDGTPIRVEAIIGDPELPGLLSSQRATDTLRKAIANAERKALVAAAANDAAARVRRNRPPEDEITIAV